MKIKFKNIRKGLEDLHTDDDLTNEDFTDEYSSELLNTEFVPPFIIDKQSSKLLNLEIETYYTAPNGSTFTYDPNAHTFAVNDVTTGMSTEFAVPPFIVEKPEVIEYGDAAIDFSSLSNEEQYRINLLLRQKNFVHSDFYKRLSALKSSMTEEQFKQYEDANKYLSIDDYGVLDLSNEPYSVLTAVLDSLEEAGYKLEEREEPIVKTKENPHNLSLREIDWKYAELNFPAGVTHPDKYHDLSITNDYYNLNKHKSTMTLSNYDKTKAIEDATLNTAVDLATLLIPLKIGGFKGMWKGLKFIGKSLLDPGSFVDFVGKTTKYATPLARSWFGASTIPGIATNLGMSGYFGYDAYKGLRENGLNWQTGLETGFAALPFVAEGAPYIVKGVNYLGKYANKAKHKVIKYLDIDRYNDLIDKIKQRSSKAELGYDDEINLSDDELDEILLLILNDDRLDDLHKKEVSDLFAKRKKTKQLLESAKKRYDELSIDHPEVEKLKKELEDAEKHYQEIYDKIKSLTSSLSKKLNLDPDILKLGNVSIFESLQELEQILKSLGVIKDDEYLRIVGDKIQIVKNIGSSEPFTLVQNEKIPILDASGKQIGELPVTTHLESGKAIISDGYIETTTNNIKALQAKFPGAKPFGSSVMVSDLQVPHFTHDYDFIITEEDAAKIAGLDKVLFNSNGFTKTVGINANGNIVPKDQGIFNVDLNIIRSGPDGKVIHNNLTEELFRHQYPELNSELTALSFVKDSNKHKVDIPMTPKELLDGYDPVVNTFLDAHEIDFALKPKHTYRILGYIIYNQNPKKIEECITQLAKAQGLTGDWRAPRSIFSNVEENEQFLKSIGLSKEDAANIAMDPKTVQNLFDYWTLDKIVRRRGVYNTPARTRINFNDPKLSMEQKREMLLNSFREWMAIGNSTNGPGLNTVRGTSGVVGSGTSGGGNSFDIIGTFSLKPDFSECKTLTEAVDKILYTVGAEEYGGAFPEILQGLTPMKFLNSYKMTPDQWKSVSKTLLDAGVLALTYPEGNSYMNRSGEYSTVVDDPNRNPIFSYLLSLIRPMYERNCQFSRYGYIYPNGRYVITRFPKIEGTIYPNIIRRLKNLKDEQDNAYFNKRSILRTLNQIFNDNRLLRITNQEVRITKMQFDNINNQVKNVLNKYNLHKMNIKIDKIRSLQNVASSVLNALEIAKWGGAIAGVMLAINKINNKFRLTTKERANINKDITTLKNIVNNLEEELKLDEKHRDAYKIDHLEQLIYKTYKHIYDNISDSTRKDLVEQYMQQQLPNFEQIKALFEKETPQNKQGGKLIPRNKFLSIYSLI